MGLNKDKNEIIVIGKPVSGSVIALTPLSLTQKVIIVGNTEEIKPRELPFATIYFKLDPAYSITQSLAPSENVHHWKQKRGKKKNATKKKKR